MSGGRKTRAVNLRKEGYDVYIGRAGHGQDGYFGNPFRLGAQPRGATIERYREYFLNRLRTDEPFARRVRALKGKTLGCFCKTHPCHGDVMALHLDTPVRLAVIVSSSFDVYALLCAVLDRFDIIEIISGGGGAQSMAERYASEHDLVIRVFPTGQYDNGPSAETISNRTTVAAADEVVAFWDGCSSGTEHTIAFARASGKVVCVYSPWP